MFDINDLKTELEDESYKELSYSEILALLKSQKIPTLGAIAGDDLRDVVTMLCSGIAYRLKMAELTPQRVMLETAFANMQIQNFQFNFAAPEVITMLEIGVQTGLILEEERTQFYHIATTQKDIWPGVTIEHIVQCLDPYQISLNQWVETQSVKPTTNTLMLQVVAPMPEADVLILEVALSVNGVVWNNFTSCLTFQGIKEPNVYLIPIPKHGTLHRKFRWKGERYKINGVMSVQ